MKKYYLLLLLCGLLDLLAQAQTNNVPSSLTGTAPAYNKVVLTWKDNSTGETKFEIERNNFASFVKIGESAANTPTYTDNTAGGGTYRVRAILATGAPTGYSNEFTISTPPAPPTTPINLLANAQSASLIRLSWTNPGAGTASEFLVERGTASGGLFTQIAVVAYSRAPGYDDNQVSGGTQYCYRVRARGPGGTSDYSTVACATTPGVPPVTPNQLSIIAVSASQLQLFWADANVQAVTFEISRADSPGGTYRVISSDYGQKIYDDKNLPASTQYCYKVRAKNSVGLYSGYSNEACGTTKAPTPTAPNAPARLAVNAVSSNQINLQWADLSDNETGFQVERATGGPTAVFSKIADLGANATTYSDQSVQPSTQYCYRVRAINTVGNSSYTDVQCTTTPAPAPGVPTNLVATAKSTTQIDLTFKAPNATQGDYYEVQRSTAGGSYQFAKNVQVDASGNGLFNDSGLQPNTRYCYKVRRYSSPGSDLSGEACSTTPDAPPASPARLTITATTYNQISLQWADLSSNESGFQIERSPDGAAWNKIADVGANTTTYNDQSVQAQTHYYYRVRAVNAAGASDYSNVVDATTPAGPPAAPQNLVATAASTTQINLTWNAVANATNILIERSPNGTDSWNQVGSVLGTATSYNDPNLTQNTHYYYRIRATNSSGNGQYSNVADATTPDAPPAAPARLAITTTAYNQISLQWADLSSNESSFQIERSPDGTAWNKITDVGANTTTYSDQTVAPQTHYYYRVRAVNGAGPSGYSNVVDVTTPVGPPIAPQNLAATAASTTQINLIWDGVANAATILVERSPNGTTDWNQVGSVTGAVTTYSDPSLTRNTHYYYRIRATNVTDTSPYSNIADATTPDVPPAAPARLTTTAISPSQISLQWADLSNNESGFEIERGSSATGTFQKVADVGANITAYEDKNLVDNTPYCYRVRAKNAAGLSAYTDPACATTPLAPPATPTNLTAQVFDYDQIRLNWSPVGATVVTVFIERSTSSTSGFSEIKQQPVGPTTYIDMGLQEFTTYYYRIRVANAAGYSGYSNVATARVDEVVIAVEDELETHTNLFVSQRTLHVVTNWFSTMHTSLQLLTTTGQPILTDVRKVNPSDHWSYNLDALPTGSYIIHIVADGRKLAKRVLLP